MQPHAMKTLFAAWALAQATSAQNLSPEVSYPTRQHPSVSHIHKHRHTHGTQTTE